MRIIYADGIGSSDVTDSQSIIYAIVERLIELNPSWMGSRVIWPASMAAVGGTKSWTKSSAIGVAYINEIVDEIPDEDLILLGYSGGNRVIHEWLESHSSKLDRVSAVGLMSDPWRPQGRNLSVLPRSENWGICGQNPGPISDRTFWVSVIGDVISDAKPDALLRTAADASDVMPGQFIGDLANHIRIGNLQLMWELKLFFRKPLVHLSTLEARLNQVRTDVDGYFNGKHTTAYINPYDGGSSLAYRLADAINDHVHV